MVGQMSANQLMKRVQRYVAKIQGTKQYWYQQRGCHFAYNYWPDLLWLLQEPNNAVPSVRIRVVIDHPHITDAYFVSILAEFCTHWLDHLINAECKWIRFEWQAHGSIHAHGCAKLSNNPGVYSLVKTAAQGWKLEQMLRLHEHPSYHQMANEVQPQILVGHQARSRHRNCVCWLAGDNYVWCTFTGELGRSLTKPLSNMTWKCW